MGTKHEGMGLSPEELAALEDDETPENPDNVVPPEPKDPPEPKEPKEPKADDDDDDDEPGDGVTPPPAADEPPAPVPEPPAPAPEGIDGDGYEKLEFADFQPYEVRHIQDFDVKIGEFDKQRAELVTKFKEGELAFEEFLVKDREIQKEEAKLRNDESDAVTMERLNEQNASRTWFSNVKAFIAEVKRVEGINYDSVALNAALDSTVKALATDPANAEKPQAWFLREAHRLVKADLGLPPRSAPKPADPAPKPVQKGRAPDLNEVPPTLRKVPAAAPNDPKGEDEFAHLDQLEGLELEEALAKLTPAEQNRYLRG